MLFKISSVLYRKYSTVVSKYLMVVTWVRGICLICMLRARGHTYVSGKSRAHMLQVICIASALLVRGRALSGSGLAHTFAELLL